MTLFDEQFEQEAIERIKKFARLAEKMGFVPVLGFSGGKDSQVCYDLCKRADITFRAVFNHCFESATTLKFIRDYYPDVEWRREVKTGFLSNVWQRHGGMLPTAEAAYCCEDYKHNSKYVDNAAIIGIRRAESSKRAGRTVLGTKNKTTLKRNRELIGNYFAEHCIASGAPSEIQLHPIVDWSDSDVWEYIKRHNIPINAEYKEQKRVGCLVCPKADMNKNYKALLKFPKLIDAIIYSREKAGRAVDWFITSDKADYTDRKPEYVCRWLNHSFRPFTKRQRKLADLVIENYNKQKIFAKKCS